LGSQAFRAEDGQFVKAQDWSQPSQTCTAVFQSIFEVAGAASSSSSSGASSLQSQAVAPAAVAAQPAQASSSSSGIELKSTFLKLIEDYRKENNDLPTIAITTVDQAEERIGKLKELKRAAQALKKFHQAVRWENTSKQKDFLKKWMNVSINTIKSSQSLKGKRAL
jgi:hypothetical protein